jgi:hypothetical protein
VRKAAAKSECMAASGGGPAGGLLGMAVEGGLLGAAMSCDFLRLVLDTRHPYLSGDGGDKNVSPVAFGCQNGDTFCFRISR